MIVSHAAFQFSIARHAAGSITVADVMRMDMELHRNGFGGPGLEIAWLAHPEAKPIVGLLKHPFTGRYLLELMRPTLDGMTLIGMPIRFSVEAPSLGEPGDLILTAAGPDRRLTILLNDQGSAESAPGEALPDPATDVR